MTQTSANPKSSLNKSIDDGVNQAINNEEWSIDPFLRQSKGTDLKTLVMTVSTRWKTERITSRMSDTTEPILYK
ncbi:hypothetical protein DM01DRAFT_301004 [Hesseltinella vesiculosa]|uniref:Uncharacterized protein n=1 Tax=Hesseltinella vesiculosa TaxID=101127 RepID=A0A1X2GGE3_9FUNG|nr:hypothetical protein DM01DRAFT_301004 [Hesseltinella vesiculosa]